MLLLATEIWQRHGGIQRYMRDLVGFATQSCEGVDILALGDARSFQSAHSKGGESIACSGNKLLFCAQVLRLAITGRGRLVLVGHINLLPLVYVAYLLGLTQRYIL